MGMHTRQRLLPRTRWQGQRMRVPMLREKNRGEMLSTRRLIAPGNDHGNRPEGCGGYMAFAATCCVPSAPRLWFLQL